MLAGALLNRLTRIGPALLVSIAIGSLLGRWIRRHERLTLSVYGVTWLLVYAVYLG